MNEFICGRFGDRAALCLMLLPIFFLFTPGVTVSAEQSSSGTNNAPPRDAATSNETTLRTWTDPTGEHKMEARLVGCDGLVVKLTKSDGNDAEIAIDNLSDSDRKYLLDHRRASIGAEIVDLSGVKLSVSPPIEKGVVVVNVFTGSPADQAGLHAGDIVASVDGTPANGFSLGYLQPGQKHQFVVHRLADANSRPSLIIRPKKSTRKWKITEGSGKGSHVITLDAEFLRTEGRVVVLDDHGRERKFPQSRFSMEDTVWLKQNDEKAATGVAWNELSLAVHVAPRAEVERLIADIKKREAEAKAAKCPLSLGEATLARDAIDNPVLGIWVANTGDKTVSAFKLSIEAFNKFDEPVRKFGFGDNETVGLEQRELVSGYRRFSKWVLAGQDAAAKFKVGVLRVKFGDGTEWRPKPGFEQEKVVVFR